MQIYLTSDEQKVFNGLSAELREGWVVEAEESKAYETDEVLALRSQIASFDRYPQVKELLKTVAAGKYEQSLTMDLPDEVLSDLFFTLGARGLSVMIGRLLGEVSSDDDIGGLSALTLVRHELLLTNQQATA